MMNLVQIPPYQSSLFFFYISFIFFEWIKKAKISPHICPHSHAFHSVPQASNLRLASFFGTVPESFYTDTSKSDSQYFVA